MEGFNPAYDTRGNPEAEDSAVIPLPAEKRQRKKKSGAFGIFKAALYMLRKRTDEKEAAAATKKAAPESNNGDWKKIVGSIRPLHAQEAPASPMHMMSPMNDAASSSSSSGTMSQYASATNLRDLCNCEDELDEEERDPDEVFDAITGDEEIDSKAEEFIAQFYKQIHHQNSIHRQHRGI